jgi:hypothetical protein
MLRVRIRQVRLLPGSSHAADQLELASRRQLNWDNEMLVSEALRDVRNQVGIANKCQKPTGDLLEPFTKN